jgi:hypothetical protein
MYIFTEAFGFFGRFPVETPGNVGYNHFEESHSAPANCVIPGF